MSAPAGCQALIEQLLKLPGNDARQLLHQNTALLQETACADTVAEAFKHQADHFLRSDIVRAATMVQLIDKLADLTANPLYRALGLRAEGNIRGIGEGNFQQAIDCYDAAAAIYRAHQRPVDEAKSQVGKIGCLALLSRYETAFAIGRSARRILKAHQEWNLFTGLTLNLAAIHHRLGQGEAALALLDEAQEICSRTGADRELPGIEVNRANVLRTMGRLEASMRASQKAQELFAQRGQEIGAALAQQGLATTYLFSGRFNEALALFERVNAIFLADHRHFDAIVVQLFLSDCMLQLGRFHDALQICRRTRTLFTQSGEQRGTARCVLNEAIAYAGLSRHSQALASLDEAHDLFQQEGNNVWATIANLEKAALLCRQAHFQDALEQALACAGLFGSHNLQIREAQARLIAARAALALGKEEEAHHLVAAVACLSESEEVPWLQYQRHYLLGDLAQKQDDLPGAIAAYDRAIGHLERLRGQLMIEFRADFLEDKQRVYEAIVLLWLQTAGPQQALQYVERAKSRALVEMLAYQLDLRLQPRSVADRPLVTKLQQLRDRRNQLMRRWTAVTGSAKEPQAQIRQQILELEQQLTKAWHTLLIRNAHYARDAALAQVRTEPVQPYLDRHTWLVEYFIAHDDLLVFLVTRKVITVQRLPGVPAQLRHPTRLLNLSLKAVPHSPPAQAARLLANSQAQLHHLYRLLIEPWYETLPASARLIIVPHGPILHYLPFHALYTGRQYLIERHQISYLPSASLLHYAAGQAKEESIDDSLCSVAFGYSYYGRLPHAVQEAQTVAGLLDGSAYIEEEATLAQLQESSGRASVLHLSTHGDFNLDNPLFSGLTLADGQLSTLDIFNLRLRAALVTLSACQTGHSVVKGGDELMGLMRAFLYAGAASLLLSHWQVYDHATMHWMEYFYRQLANGRSKGAALQATQRHFIHNAGIDDRYRHPYYWAPFFLVGDTRKL